LERKSLPLLLLISLLPLLLLLALLESDAIFVLPEPAAAAAAPEPMYRAMGLSTLLLLLLLTALTPSLLCAGGGELDESNATHSIGKAREISQDEIKLHFAIGSCFD
jgi:hypothetical protein